MYAKILIFGLFLLFFGDGNAQNWDTVSTKNLMIDSISINKDSSNSSKSIAKEAIVDQEPMLLKTPLNTLERFGDAVVYTWASPLRWKKKDWLIAGSVVGATALLFLVDKPINNFWSHQQAGVFNTIEKMGYHYGKPYTAVIAVGGFYAAGLIFKSDWAKETALILGSSYLSSGAFQSLIKKSVGRARPFTGVGNMSFNPWSASPGYHSFPSGHIQIAITTATVLANRIKNPYLQTFFYATAATTLVSRMYSHSHWISDLFMGGVTSYYMAKTNIKRWKMSSHQAPFTDMIAKKPKIIWNMGATNDGIGLVGHF